MNDRSSEIVLGRSSDKIESIFFCQGLAEPVSFLNCPFTFQRIDCEVGILQSIKYFRNAREMIFPRVGKDPYVVNVDIDFWDVTEEVFHERLYKV